MFPQLEALRSSLRGLAQTLPPLCAVDKLDDFFTPGTLRPWRLVVSKGCSLLQKQANHIGVWTVVSASIIKCSFPIGILLIDDSGILSEKEFCCLIMPPNRTVVDWTLFLTRPICCRHVRAMLDEHVEYFYNLWRFVDIFSVSDSAVQGSKPPVIC